METSRSGVIFAAVVVAFSVGTSLVASTVVASRAYRDRGAMAAAGERELTVRGSARVRVVSDTGVWRLTVRTENKSVQLAVRDLEKGAVRLQDFLESRGFTPEEVRASPIDTMVHYALTKDGRETREVAGYTLSRTLTVESAKVQAMAAAAGEVTRLLSDTLLVEARPPEFLYSKLPDLRVQITGEATKDGLARAQEIAANSGSRLGEVRRAQLGPMQVTQPFSTDVSGGGVYDTGTIEKDVSVVVTLTVGVERGAR